jgi:hypothetical protein
MITVDRGPEPPQLRATREQHLRDSIDAFNQHGPRSRSLLKGLTGYGVAKPHLFRRQHKKCAYCEQYTPLDETPTEHFRPKRALVETGVTVTPPTRIQLDIGG